MKFSSLLKGNRFEHREAHAHMTKAAEFWVPNPRDQMEIRELVERWTEEGRRYAEGRGR